ncbi:glycosyltransferase family 4 protein [Methylobacterium sp. 77]|uniref:glycosyltransferase family 4 protein n=1 Tax=Methylobacterium sp. 77 TaxID=1101192 RepID=UPI000380F39E|nr:glycosyltransferase family 4 protein [Methylobacterium sp. 77]
MSASASVLSVGASLNEGKKVHRILHVFRAPVGGLFRHVCDLARLQAAAGHKVGLICDSSTGGERAIEALNDLLPHLELGIVRLPMRRNPHGSDIVVVRAVARRARGIGATILHGHGAKGGAYARLAGMPSNLPSLIRAYTPHGGSYNYKPGTLRHRIYMGVERLLATRTDVFLFESEYVAGRHRRFVGGRPRTVRIVHNGIDEAEFVPVQHKADAYDLVYVGELREAKGIPVLLDALVGLHAEGRPTRLLMVGSGPDADQLAERARQLGLSGSVAFEPPQPIRAALAKGRIMVVPSLAESLPYVVLEAAAAQQPLVSTNVGGIPEIFGAAATDLVGAGDPFALKRAIVRLLDEDPAQGSARSRALGEFVQTRFSMKRMGADVLSGYAAALRVRAASIVRTPLSTLKQLPKSS